MVYFLVLVIVAAVTPVAQEYPRLSMSAGLVTLSCGLIRLVSSIRILRHHGDLKTALLWCRLSTVLVFGFWGLLQAWVTIYQPDEAAHLMLLVSSAALAAGACTSLAPDPLLARVCVTLMICPIAAGFFLRGDPVGLGMGVMIAIYYVFLLAQSHQNIESYWGALRMKESQAALVAAEGRAKGKAELLAQMSHEIRTPLHGVVGTLDLLNGTTLTERQREYAQMARTASLSLLDVLNSILDFSKSEAGKMKLEAVDFPLRPRLEAALGPLRLAARAKGLEFAINWDPQLNTHYVGDPLRLAQVLTNLTSNAIKFTRAGVVGVRAQLQERQAGADRVTFTVRDTGAGIPEDVQVRLFEPFEQAGTSTSRQYGGSGLGLAICKQLVELMGGQLSLASVVGKGSSFSFTVALPAAASRPLVEELPRPIAPQPGVRVLVAEDNAVSRKVVVALLERLGHQVDTVTNGEEAVTAAATGSYALVLMDCQMPVLDGLAAAEQIRAAGVNSPIIALTASAAQEDRARALAAGMDDYLAKPYSADQLANLLAGITSRRSSAQAGG
jgi:signal transduction histidine kinase/ActR/RegA family two-component response regulator